MSRHKSEIFEAPPPRNEIEHAARNCNPSEEQATMAVTTYQRTIINCADTDYANYRERIFPIDRGDGGGDDYHYNRENLVQ